MRERETKRQEREKTERTKAIKEGRERVLEIVKVAWTSRFGYACVYGIYPRTQ